MPSTVDSVLNSSSVKGTVSSCISDLSFSSTGSFFVISYLSPFFLIPTVGCLLDFGIKMSMISLKSQSARPSGSFFARYVSSFSIMMS